MVNMIFGSNSRAYEGGYADHPLWANIVKKLTIRQAYIYYYSLAYYEKNQIAKSLGILDLPDETMVHKCLMDNLLKQENPRDTAQIISDNAHEILINDTDLIWLNNELRAALWLSYFVVKVHSESDEMLLDTLRSTSKIAFTKRLIHVLDIFGCSRKGENSFTIHMNFNSNSPYNLGVNSSSLFNMYRSNYVTTRISDHKLSWLDKLPVAEIDNIIDKFAESKILAMAGVFVAVTKEDKVELIKASLDIQYYKYMDQSSKEALRIYTSTYEKPYRSTKSDEATNEDERVESTTNNRKDFASLSVEDILDLLKKAYNARKHRKATSTTKTTRSIALSKDSYTVAVKLSKQLGTTPKQVVEALMKRVDLENESEVLEIDRLISGKRSTKAKPTKSKEHEKAIEIEEVTDSKQSIEVDEDEKDLERKPDQINKRESQAKALLEFKRRR